jgi:hypothetical protein
MRQLWRPERTQGRDPGLALVAGFTGHLFCVGGHDAGKLGSRDRKQDTTTSWTRGSNQLHGCEQTRRRGVGQRVGRRIYWRKDHCQTFNTLKADAMVDRFGTLEQKKQSTSSERTFLSRRSRSRKLETSCTRARSTTTSRSGICERRPWHTRSSDTRTRSRPSNCRRTARVCSPTRTTRRCAHGTSDPLRRRTDISAHTMARRQAWKRICCGQVGIPRGRKLWPGVGTEAW